MKSFPLKSLLGLKIFILGGLLMVHFNYIKIGETDLFGQDKKDSKPKASDGNQQSTEGNSKNKNTSKETVNTSERARKSFISDLLELPTLDPQSIKKEELGKFIEIANRKERQIIERLDLLKKKENQLKELEKSVEEKISVLDEERKFFAQSIQKEKDLKNERVTQLITLYAKMEPKKAAPVFEKLDRDLVVELFKQLPQKQVTAILEAMTPERSVALSEYYGRVRSAREYDLLKEMNQSLKKEFDDCKGMPPSN
jgi:flagellar motility protein MotE (MotC chaperone)